MAAPKWSDLTSTQQRCVLGAIVVQGALKAAAYRDLARRPERRVRGSKRAWRLALLLNPGALAYFAFGRLR